MAPAQTGFKTYEGQALLLRAILAAHPGMKFDVKKIHHYVGYSTEAGIRWQLHEARRESRALANRVDGVAAAGPSSAAKAATTTAKKAGAAKGNARKRKAPKVEEEDNDEDPAPSAKKVKTEKDAGRDSDEDSD